MHLYIYRYSAYRYIVGHLLRTEIRIKKEEREKKECLPYSTRTSTSMNIILNGDDAILRHDTRHTRRRTTYYHKNKNLCLRFYREYSLHEPNRIGVLVQYKNAAVAAVAAAAATAAVAAMAAWKMCVALCHFCFYPFWNVRKQVTRTPTCNNNVDLCIFPDG